jgi:16S rRNA G1207 methylase RsmC
LTPSTADADVHYKKTIEVRLHGRRLRLDVAQDLFSGADVDAGTRLLLRTLAAPEHAARLRVVDLGSGYGPLGLGLKLLVPEREVLMLDRDALAVRYSRRNAELNGMTRVEAAGGLGWSGAAGKRFHLAVCNVPAKAGERAIRHFLIDAGRHLSPGGLVAVVVIARLEGLVQSLLTHAAGIRLTHSQRTAGYSVFHYGFAATPATPAAAVPDELGFYERTRLEMSLRDLRYRMRVAYSLPEFDSLGYQTRLVAERMLSLGNRPRHLLVFNPGQGHLAVLAWRLFGPERITLVGRDLLALRYSQDNAVRNGCPPERLVVRHQVGTRAGDADDVDLALALVPEGQPAAITTSELQPLLSELRPPARLLLGGGSTDITRLEAALAPPLRTAGRKRNRGHSVLELVLPPVAHPTKQASRGPRAEGGEVGGSSGRR